jgi:tRNA G18 (ribose-2'-O)-methylase SpoU
LAVERFLSRIEVPIPDSVPVYVVSEETLRTVTGFGFYQGVMALGEREPIPKTETMIGSEAGGAWVILPNTLKPDNLGLIFRSCAALGARGVILGEQCCDPFSRRALRVSMGGVLQVPIYQSDTLAGDLVKLRDEAGFELCATVLDDDAVSLYKCGDWEKQVGFVFGHEFSGLTEPWLSCCTKKIMIPIAPGVDSLNLGVSVGVFLYEYNRGISKSRGR